MLKTGTFLVQWIKSYDKNGKKILVFEKFHFLAFFIKKDIIKFLAILGDFLEKKNYHFLKNLGISKNSLVKLCVFIADLERA